MQPLRNLKLAYRFAILVACVLLGFAIYGFWSFRTLGELKVNGPIYQHIIQGKDLVADILPPPEYIIESYLVGLQLEVSPENQHAGLIEHLKELKAEYDERHAFWQNQDLSVELQQTLLNQAHIPVTTFYGVAFNEFIPAIQRADSAAAAEAMVKMKAAYEMHRQAIDKAVQIANNRVKTDETVAGQLIQSSIQTMLLVLAITILITIGLAIMISSSVGIPLSIMQKTMLEIQNMHDFTRRIEILNKDEIGLTAQTFNELTQSIHSALLHLLEDANQVSRAANELSTASQQLAVSSGQQSSSASSIAATLEQVNVSIGNVTNSAREAVDISRQSGNLSNQGGDIIHNATSAMMLIAETVQQTSSTIEDLGQQSYQISSVVQVIKDVADQTNLLALNAAIEAARAGEQGRGFAVVADEVRNLAKRTTKATEEISQMIKTMQTSTGNAISVMSAAVTKADEGAVIARQAGDAINQIKMGSNKVVEVVNCISDSLMEHNSASNNIATQVELVAHMAEENNAAVGQTASAAARLEKLASDMRSTVSKFKL
jgi:methyl-accepting chemotaxis protein